MNNIYAPAVFLIMYFGLILITGGVCLLVQHIRKRRYERAVYDRQRDAYIEDLERKRNFYRLQADLRKEVRRDV